MTDRSNWRRAILFEASSTHRRDGQRKPELVPLGTVTIVKTPRQAGGLQAISRWWSVRAPPPVCIKRKISTLEGSQQQNSRSMQQYSVQIARVIFDSGLFQHFHEFLSERFLAM